MANLNIKMECVVCYRKSDEEEDPRIKATFVTLPCEGTQHLNQKHTMCFHCFIANHMTSRGTCPVCRDNYMDFVGGSAELIQNESFDRMSLAGNLASPIPPPEVISWQDAEIYDSEIYFEQPVEEEQPVETFEEFARYVMEHLSYDVDEPDDVLIITGPEQEPEPPLNCCIVCGIDMGEENPRQYCEKTYCPEL